MISQRDDHYAATNTSKSRINPSFPIQNQAPQSKNELSSLYDQLRETNSRIKEGPSNGNSMLLAGAVDDSIEKTQYAQSFSRFKDDEIKKMRNDKLEKIRQDKNNSTIRTPKRGDFSSAEGRDASPKFFQERSQNPNTSGLHTNFGKETFHQDAVEDEEGVDAIHDNIDIARDYLLYSAQKSSEDQKTFSQYDNSVYQHTEDNFGENKFFERQRERDHAYKLLQDQINEDVRLLANSKKMSQNSYKIMIRKLEASLSSVLLDVDKDGQKLISFEQLGRMFSLLEIFRVIQYDENCNLENEEQFFSGSPEDQKRRFQEMVIHEEVWKLLADNEETEYVDTEFVYIFFRILLDPANLSHSETVKILQEYIEKYRREHAPKETLQTEQQENWQLLELVKNFKKLTENRLYYNRTGYFKPEKADEVVQTGNDLTFKPKIGELSQALDKHSTQKFLEKNPLEAQSRSKSPYKANAKENLDNLLFDLKSMQGALQGKNDYNNRTYTQGTESVLKGRETVQQEDNLDNRVKILLKKHEVAEKRKEEQRKMKALDGMKDCTFQPLIKNYRNHTNRNPKETVDRLYNHNRTKKKQEEERIMEQIEKETKEMEGCTFKPNINNNAVLSAKEVPKGFEKNIIRMRYAIDETRKKKEALEKKSVGENYERLRNANIKPFSFVDNPRYKRKAPFVYIEINVAPGRTGRIGIHEDDDPRILAKNFAIAFQITEDMERNLEEIIIQQLNDHFEKQQYEEVEQ